MNKKIVDAVDAALALVLTEQESLDLDTAAGSSRYNVLDDYSNALTAIANKEIRA